MTKFLCLLNPEHEYLNCECRVVINNKAYCMDLCSKEKKIPCRFRQAISVPDEGPWYGDLTDEMVENFNPDDWEDLNSNKKEGK